MHCGGLATVVCLLVMPPRKADAPPHPPVPPPSMHPERWAPEQQPAPVPNPKGGLNSKWYVQALVCRKGTGKAANTTIQEKSPRIYAATADLAMMEQQKFINEYLHPSKRTKQQHGGGGCSSTAGSSSSEHTTEPTEPRPSRAAAPNDLKEEQVYAGGPRAGSARAGPGVSAARHGAVLGLPLAVWGRVWGGSRVRAALERGRMPRPGAKRFTDARTRLVDVCCRVLRSQVTASRGTARGSFSASRWPFGVGFGADPACARRSSEAACQDPDQNALRTHERA